MAALPTPLTTTFTPSPTCLRDIHWNTATPLYILGEYNTACLPPGPNPTLSSYYSPGLYCPFGFTVACSSSTTISTDIETRAVCCPSLAAQQFGSGFSCTKPPSFGPWSSYGCVMGFGGFATSSTPLTIVVEGSTTSTMLKPTDVNGGVNAYSVQIRWRESDLRTTSAGTSTSSMSSTGQNETRPSSVQQTSTGAAQTAESVQTSGAGMSAGAKIAVGVVVPLVVLLIIAGMFLVWKRRNSKQGYAQPPEKGMLPVQAMSNERYEVQGSSVKIPTTIPQEIADTSSDWSRTQMSPPPVYR